MSNVISNGMPATSVPAILNKAIMGRFPAAASIAAPIASPHATPRGIEIDAAVDPGKATGCVMVSYDRAKKGCDSYAISGTANLRLHPIEGRFEIEFINCARWMIRCTRGIISGAAGASVTKVYGFGAGGVYEISVFPPVAFAAPVVPGVADASAPVPPVDTARFRPVTQHPEGRTGVINDNCHRCAVAVTMRLGDAKMLGWHEDTHFTDMDGHPRRICSECVVATSPASLAPPPPPVDTARFRPVTSHPEPSRPGYVFGHCDVCISETANMTLDEANRLGWRESLWHVDYIGHPVRICPKCVARLSGVAPAVAPRDATTGAVGSLVRGIGVSSVGNDAPAPRDAAPVPRIAAPVRVAPREAGPSAVAAARGRGIESFTRPVMCVDDMTGDNLGDDVTSADYFRVKK